MKDKKLTKQQKIDRIIEILSDIDEAHLEALLILLDRHGPVEYEITDAEYLVLEEGLAKYERGETKGMSGAESVRQLKEHLKKIQKNKKHEYVFSEAEEIRIEEEIAKYERGEAKFKTGAESVRKLKESLRAIRKK